MHASEPGTLLYVPTAHAAHGPVRSGPVYPGLHWYTPEVVFSVAFFGTHGPPPGPAHHASHAQSVMLPLPADEFEFSGQVAHVALPVTFLYVPVGHALHWPLEAPKSGPVYPVLHEHNIADKQHIFSHGVLVRSTPWIIASDIAVVAAVLRYSSTTKTPARSAFK